MLRKVEFPSALDLVGLCFIALLSFSLVYLSGASRAMEVVPTESNAVENDSEDSSREDKAESSRLRHVVLFQFKASSSQEEIAQVVQAFRELPKQIPQIAEFEYGTNNSPEGLEDGFTHCFLVTFRSEEDRDSYLPHPHHQRFVEILRPHLEKVLVVDYWAKH